MIYSVVESNDWLAAAIVIVYWPASFCCVPGSWSIYETLSECMQWYLKLLIFSKEGSGLVVEFPAS